LALPGVPTSPECRSDRRAEDASVQEVKFDDGTADGRDTHRGMTTPDAPFKVWRCMLCGFTYDEAAGLASDGIPAGTRWSEVPADWTCPDCSVSKADFEMVEA
jgi:rubredoxin